MEGEMHFCLMCRAWPTEVAALGDLHHLKNNVMLDLVIIDWGKRK